MTNETNNRATNTPTHIPAITPAPSPPAYIKNNFFSLNLSQVSSLIIPSKAEKWREEPTLVTTNNINRQQAQHQFIRNKEAIRYNETNKQN